MVSVGSSFSRSTTAKAPFWQKKQKYWRFLFIILLIFDFCWKEIKLRNQTLHTLGWLMSSKDLDFFASLDFFCKPPISHNPPILLSVPDFL